jgi:hypothetical protein
VDLELDGKRLAVVRSDGTNSDQLETSTTALREDTVLPTRATSTAHTVTASARLADHSGEGFTDACAPASQVDAFALHVIGTR